MGLYKFEKSNFELCPIDEVKINQVNDVNNESSEKEDRKLSLEIDSEFMDSVRGERFQSFYKIQNDQHLKSLVKDFKKNLR